MLIAFCLLASIWICSLSLACFTLRWCLWFLALSWVCGCITWFRQVCCSLFCFFRWRSWHSDEGTGCCCCFYWRFCWLVAWFASSRRRECSFSFALAESFLAAVAAVWALIFSRYSLSICQFANTSPCFFVASCSFSRWIALFIGDRLELVYTAAVLSSACFRNLSLSLSCLVSLAACACCWGLFVSTSLCFLAVTEVLCHVMVDVLDFSSELSNNFASEFSVLSWGRMCRCFDL